MIRARRDVGSILRKHARAPSRPEPCTDALLLQHAQVSNCEVWGPAKRARAICSLYRVGVPSIPTKFLLCSFLSYLVRVCLIFFFRRIQHLQKCLQSFRPQT